jgi:glyoxylase-like metal-dependent hydrolase (beta-lactamase superfamily II)
MLDLTVYDSGYCTHKEKIAIRTGRSCQVKFVAMFVHIYHPIHGHILFDTGYSNRFYKETTSFPASIYGKLTPVYVNETDTAVSKLKHAGVEAEKVKYIIISHFHADHICALRDFNNAQFICLETAYLDVKGRNSFQSLLKGFLPGLLPNDFANRVRFIDETLKVTSFSHAISSRFENCYDIFNDGTIIGVELPGHAKGQLGIYLFGSGREMFFVADSVWLSSSYEKNIPPSHLAHLTVNNKKAYRETIDKLYEIDKEAKDIVIVPSHCGQKYLELVKDSKIDHKKLSGVWT